MKKNRLILTLLVCLVASISMFTLSACIKIKLQTSVGIDVTQNDDGTGYTAVGIGTCTDSVLTLDLYQDQPITCVKSNAFSGSDVEAIMLGSALRTIEQGAFSDCDNVFKVTIFDGTTTIEKNAFKGCDNLLIVSLPDTLRDIDATAFDNCPNLEYTVSNGLKYLGNKDNPYLCLMGKDNEDTTNVIVNDKCKIVAANAFKKDYDITEASLGNGVQYIGKSAFYYCSRLNTLSIGNALTEIAPEAFEYCSSLEQISTQNVQKIGYSAFSQCDRLKQVTFSNTLQSIGSRAFSNCYSLENVSLPDSVTDIGPTTFSSCPQVQSVRLSNKLENIPAYAFSDCKSLTEIVIPDSVTVINEGAFNTCSSLAKVTFSANLTTIEDSAFVSCEALTGIDLPDSLTALKSNAFTDCTNLRNVKVGPNIAEFNSNAFNGTKVAYNVDNNLMYLGAQDNDYYYLIRPQSLLGETYEINANCKVVAAKAFAMCYKLTNVVIPKSVTVIGSYIFSQSTNVSAVFYQGSLSDWNKIDVGYFSNASQFTVYLYLDTAPVNTGSFWHYVDGVPTIW